MIDGVGRQILSPLNSPLNPVSHAKWLLAGLKVLTEPYLTHYPLLQVKVFSHSKFEEHTPCSYF